MLEASKLLIRGLVKVPGELLYCEGDVGAKGNNPLKFAYNTTIKAVKVRVQTSRLDSL